MLKRLLFLIYNFLGKKLGVCNSDWDKISIVPTEDFHVVTFTSKHKVDSIEGATIFASQLGLGNSLPALINAELYGEQEIKGTSTISKIQERVLKEHYEKMYEKTKNQVTRFKIHEGTLSNTIDSIECQTILIKPKTEKEKKNNVHSINRTAGQ